MFPSLPECLRLHDEPCRLVSDPEVHECVVRAPADYLAFLAGSLAAIARGSAQAEIPRKQIFADPAAAGDFRVMPCVVRSGEGAFKTVKVVGTDLVGRIVPDQVTVGKALVLHPEENFVTHVVDACLFSSARTGACAALAASKLCPQAESLTIVGAGRVAYYAGLLFAAGTGVRRIVLQDTISERADLMAIELGRELDADVESVAWNGVPSPSDALLLATTAAVPFVGLSSAAASLTISVGADTFEQRELDSTWSALPEIVVDTLDALEVGDLRAWAREGARLPKLRTLLGLYTEPQGVAQARLFISSGSALLDNLSLNWIVGGLEAALASEREVAAVSPMPR